jgi:internalin A
MNREELLAVIEEAKQSRQTMLDLSWSHIEDLPEEIQELDSLTHLNLSHNRLRTLPESIGRLINLVSLEVMNNQLTSLPESIGELNRLVMLDVRSNTIQQLPWTIGNLNLLETFRLWENRLDEIPESIGSLTELTSLNLGLNQLRHLPDSIGMLLNLTDLTACRNQLEILPNSIGQLFNLRRLDLSCNQICTLPDSTAFLKSLEIANFRDNKLVSLPAEIGQMKSLKKLDCNNNTLESIPNSIGELKQLESLILYRNNLHDLPDSITNLSSLKEDEFFLGENPWAGIPPEIVNQGSKSILRYCLQRLNEGTFERLYEAKLMIIGEGGAGKTTLAKKLEDISYYLDTKEAELTIVNTYYFDSREAELTLINPEEKSTKGIDVMRLDFRHPSGNFFRINIWDFGGQAIYHATHQFFLTKRSLYILVADARQENTDFNYWLEIVELLSGASPICIVKNEKQDRQCPMNENVLRGRFANLKEVISANFATNRGHTEILNAVQYHISKLPHVGALLPKTWVYVRQALEDDQRNYIAKSVFFELCDTYKFSDCVEDRLQLSSYLHDLGVCLHFQDDSILKNWVILKPEWGTIAVYTVLDTLEVQKNFGRFTYADLAEIWAAEQYTDMRDELLQLMIRFKLCYEIPHSPRTYIAPQLLSSNQPEYAWDNTENLILRYHYSFMPKGMLTRFTVEMHRLIDDATVWKEGLILADGNARAEVIETYYRNEIRIRISGKIKKPLLEKIRHEFDKIHDSYGDRLRYQEYIPCNCSTCKGSQSPFSYPLNRLEERLKNDRHEIECDISYEKVNVRSLIDDAGVGNRRSNIGNLPSDESSKGQLPSLELTQDGIHHHYYSGVPEDMTNVYQKHTGSGDNIAGDKVMGNKNLNSQNLAKAAQDIKALLDQLAIDYPTDDDFTKAGRVVGEIKKNPTLTKRLINAAKESSFTAVEKAIEAVVENPAVGIIVAGVKGFIDAEG